MLRALTGFVDELRESGIPVSMVEAIDAMEAIREVDVAHREGVREALRATLVKSARHQRAFDQAFDIYFALAPAPEATTERDESDEQMPSTGTDDVSALIDALSEALAAGDSDRLRALARQAVDALAGMEPGRPVGGTYYLYRTMRRLDTARMEAALAEALAGEGELGELEDRLIREEAAARLEGLRREIEEEIRRRLVEDRGRAAVARTLRRPLVEDIDLMHATGKELAEMEAAIGPLTRKLAARLARRRRKRDGRLDFRRTVRRSLSTGGVPTDPQFRHPRPHRPEVWLLCDLSGSMATFSRFTLQFTHAMSSHFSRLRSFAFVDTVDEVTSYLGPGVDFGSAVGRITTEAEVVWLDGHSDYGNTFETFLTRYGGQLTPRTTLIVAGDARNNYRPARAGSLAEMARMARALIWLNPEPRSYWDTGDSVMSEYARHCTSTHEVRSLRQLEDFVESLALPGPMTARNA